MKTEKIIEEINTLMHEYDVSTFKPIPYLGLVWRDIELTHYNTITFSKPDDDDLYYLDMAWKWGYTMVELTLEEAHPILEQMLIALKAMIELTTSLKISNQKEAE